MREEASSTPHPYYEKDYENSNNAHNPPGGREPVEPAAIVAVVVFSSLIFIHNGKLKLFKFRLNGWR